MEIKTIQLRCQTCGGMMTVEDNNSVLSCPYCGSKELIRESDDVVIERIKNETYKDVELNKLQYEEQKEKRIEEKEMVQKFKKSGFSKIIIAAFIICLLVCINSFSQVKIMPGIIALVQTVLFALAWLMGMNIIKEKRPNIHIVFAVIGFILIIPFFSANSKLPTKSQKYEWPETGISTVLPKPEAEKGNIVINSNESFYISLDDVTEKQYQNYLKECQERGFTVDSETDSYGYTAYNFDGYKLTLKYYNSLGELNIDLDAPINMKELKWPNSDTARLLPIPKSSIGHINWENSNGFFIYVGNTSKDDFDNYVDACKNNGFTVDYKSGDKYYRSNNADGYHLDLSYEGNDTMSIEIKAPNKTETKTEVTTSTETTVAADNSDKPQKNGFDENTAKKVISGNYIISIPNYWKEDTPNELGMDYRGYAETGGKVAMLMITSATDTTDPATFEVLYDDKDNMIKGLTEAMSNIGNCEFIGSDTYETEELKGMSFNYNFTSDEYGVDGKSTYVVFPSEKDNKWIYISIIVTSNTDYRYDEDFEKILSAIKKIDENSVTETKVSTSSSNGVTPELKAFLDEYEAFWDEYVTFYKSYMDSLSSGDYLSMLSGYADMLEKLDEYEEKLDEMEKKLDEIDEDELSAEDYAYYLEVTTRIYMKMLEMYQ